VRRSWGRSVHMRARHCTDSPSCGAAGWPPGLWRCARTCSAASHCCEPVSSSSCRVRHSCWNASASRRLACAREGSGVGGQGAGRRVGA
jgi:hypothetical protein